MLIEEPTIPTSNNPQLTLARGLSAIKPLYPRLYFALAHHRTTRKERLTFTDKPWLKAIYQDQAHHIVIMKCIQVGITEYALCSMFALAEAGKRGMFLWPDDSWLQTFVADRIDGLMNMCPEYAAAIGAVDKQSDSRTFKSIYGSAWKFAGTHARTVTPVKGERGKPKAAFEFQASVLIIDEFDHHDQRDMEYFYDRLGDEKEPIIIKLGNPTAENWGISVEFRKSDQKRWMVKCPCGTETELDWYKHFVVRGEEGQWSLRDKDFRAVCENCNQPFDRCGEGYWKKHNPKSVISGYAVSRLFVHKAGTDIQELWVKFLEAQGNPSALQNFHNNWLGVPYENADMKVTEALLEQCAAKGPEFMLGPPLTETPMFLIAGVDQGKDFHIKISEVVDGVRIPRHFAIRQSWVEVNSILDAYQVGCVVVDAQGGGYAETRQFVEQREGAWMCYYVAKDKVGALYKTDRKAGVVSVNRTEMCDLSLQHMRQGLWLLPKNYATLCAGEVKSHLMVPVRMLDAGGRPIWTKGVDHFFHANIYETVALLVSGVTNSIRKSASWRVSRT